MRLVFRLFFIVTFLCVTTAQAGLKLEASANRTHIYQDESVILSVKVSGIDDPSLSPNISKIQNCRIEQLGSQSASSRSITIINGRASQQVSLSRTFNYRLTPLSAGKFQAGPISLKTQGKTLETEGPTITVIGLQEQDDVILSVSASRETVLVDEPFEIMLSILIRPLPPPNDSKEPLHADTPPHLSIPFLTPDQGEELDAENINTLLQTHVVRRGMPGFSLNNYVEQADPFDFENMFNFDLRMKSKPIKFSFDRSAVISNNISYLRYTVKRRYIARELGNYTFGPVTFKGPVITSISGDGVPFAQQIFAVGAAAVVRVVPPPEVDRPSSFIGVIGSNMTVQASLDTHKCKVGDPLTLNLSVSGDINLRNIQYPDFAAQTNLEENFKFYPETIRMIKGDNERSFTVTVKPVKAGTLEFPPIEISYYDSGARAYKTLKTAPIPLRADKGDEVDAGSIIDTVENRKLSEDKSDSNSLNLIRPFNPEPVTEDKDSFQFNIIILTIALLGPALFLLVKFHALSRKVVVRFTVNRRRTNALNRALKMLAKAEHAPSEKIAPTICKAIKLYFRERFDIASKAITHTDLKNMLAEKNVPAENAASVCEILERNFNEAFSGNNMYECDKTDIDVLKQQLTIIDRATTKEVAC